MPVPNSNYIFLDTGSIAHKGYSLPLTQSLEYDYESSRGGVVRITEKCFGWTNATNRVQSLIDANFPSVKYTSTQNGDTFLITAEKNTTPSSSLWQWRKEINQKSIYNHPKIANEIVNFKASQSLYPIPHDTYKNILTQAVESGYTSSLNFLMTITKSGQSNVLQYPYVDDLYTNLLQGVENYEDEYYVLTKIDTYNVTNTNYSYPSFQSTKNTITYENFFTASGPGADCPDNIKNVFPSSPNFNTGSLGMYFTWGFRERTNNGNREGLRYGVTREYVLSYWSDLLYLTNES